MNAQNLKSNKGNKYTLKSIQWIRHKYNIPSYLQRKPGELSVEELAEKLGVKQHVVRSWIKEGVIKSRKANGYRYWILLTPEEESVLRQKISSKN